MNTLLQDRQSRTWACMAAPTTGAGSTPRVARQVHVGRSDGRAYTTEEINAKRKAVSKQVGDPFPEDPNQIVDAESRKKVLLWKLVVATGLSEELGWPQGNQTQSLNLIASIANIFHQMHNTN